MRRRRGRKNNSRAENRFERAVTMSLAFLFFHRFRVQNQQKISQTTSPDEPCWLRGAICLAMRAPGEPLGAVGGSSGAKMGAQGSPNKKFENFRVPPRARKSTKRAPKKPPRAPKTSPREPQNTIKSIFKSQTLIFRKPGPRRYKIKVFEGRRVSLRAQNRHQEARREGK